MPVKRLKLKAHEYRFKIDAYSPETMPLDLLTQYLADLAKILGESSSVHLIRIEKSSTCPVMLIKPEAEPKIKERLDEIEQGDAPPDIMEAVARINRRLRLDNAEGAFVNPDGENLIVFPGRRQEVSEYGPFSQPGTLDGVPVMVGGTREKVSIHLEGRHHEKYICSANRIKAKEIASHLFTTVIRVEGVGRWVRHPEGDWEMLSFRITDFQQLGDIEDISLINSIKELRAIPAEWKQLDDPIDELKRIRYSDEN